MGGLFDFSTSTLQIKTSGRRLREGGRVRGAAVRSQRHAASRRRLVQSECH